MKFGIVLSLVLTFALPTFAEEVDASSQTAKVETVSAADVMEAAHAKSEDQIPVDFSKVKKTETSESSSGRLFLTFGILVIVLGGGYYLAKRYGRPSNSPQTKIKILTQHYLGPKKSLAIVRVAGESILIGVTDHNISMLKSLSLLDDEIPETLPGTSFQETFNEKKEMVVEKTGPAFTKESGEEFSIRHIKDVVSLKLKGMRGDV
jgi:flagellar protein FliO/FliZ